MKREGEPEDAKAGSAKKPKIDVAAMKAKLQQKLSKLNQVKRPADAAKPEPAQPAGLQPAPAATPPQSDAKAAPIDDTELFDPTLNTRKRKPGLNLFQLSAVPDEHQNAIHEMEAERQARAAAPAAPPPPDAPAQLFSNARRDPVPDIEWWDVPILAQPNYELQEDGRLLLNEAKITNLVEHPVPIEPPAERPPPPPQALKLTKKEMKKIRKQRREEREQEKQRNIAVGLLEPPAPKVRLSNMPRVYGADGVIDATAIEMKVREAQREREAAHEDRNLARKLTGAERKEKKLRKMFDDSAVDTQVEVFRVSELQNGKHLYKVEINATENRLTGVCVTTKTGSNAVVVEGDRKGIRRFNRLMMHRIDWNPLVTQDADDDAMFKEPNKCYCVWQGVVAKPQFSGFQVHKFGGDGEARQFMAAQGVVQYWDAAACFVPTVEEAAT